MKMVWEIHFVVLMAKMHNRFGSFSTVDHSVPIKL